MPYADLHVGNVRFAMPIPSGISGTDRPKGPACDGRRHASGFVDVDLAVADLDSLHCLQDGSYVPLVWDCIDAIERAFRCRSTDLKRSTPARHAR